jgi:hypothetical protein
LSKREVRLDKVSTKVDHGDDLGSNGYRTRARKTRLAALAAETGLQITCCHFPPGTSKWNKCVWPGGRPGAMKCSRWLAGRGRRLETGALRVRNKSGAGPAGPGIVACEHEPQIRLTARSSPAGCAISPSEEEPWSVGWNGGPFRVSPQVGDRLALSIY